MSFQRYVYSRNTRIQTIYQIVEGDTVLEAKTKKPIKNNKPSTSALNASENHENIKVAIRVRPQLDYETDEEEAISVVDVS